MKTQVIDIERFVNRHGKPVLHDKIGVVVRDPRSAIYKELKGQIKGGVLFLRGFKKGEGVK